MKLTVPYYSQFVDVQDPFWMLRACGACSFKSIIEFHGKEIPDIVSLCKEAFDRGGYDLQSGWVHDYLVIKAKELGFQAHRREGIYEIKELVEFLDKGSPVIVSVEKRVLEQKRFHMVVLVGYEEDNGKITQLYYHESESTDKEKGKYRVCTVDAFLEYFRNKAIFIEKI
jgi:uncharacterized protein YvpB